MTVRVEFLRVASKEVERAFEWYEEQRVGLGAEFLLTLEATLERIRRNPEGRPLLRTRTRKRLIRRAPYVVLSALEADGNVLITSVFHGMRDPRVWTDRVCEARAEYERTTPSRGVTTDVPLVVGENSFSN